MKLKKKICWTRIDQNKTKVQEKNLAFERDLRFYQS